MPWSQEWIPNQLFLEHNGVRIFHVYIHDEADCSVTKYGTASDSSSLFDETTFRLTSLPSWQQAISDGQNEDVLQYDLEAVKVILCRAIDLGELATYIDHAYDRPRATDEEFDLDRGLARELVSVEETLTADQYHQMFERLAERVKARIKSVITLITTRQDERMKQSESEGGSAWYDKALFNLMPHSADAQSILEGFELNTAEELSFDGFALETLLDALKGLEFFYNSIKD